MYTMLPHTDNAIIFCCIFRTNNGLRFAYYAT